MKNLIIISVLWSATLTIFSCNEKNAKTSQAKEKNALAYVNPFIGTAGHGHTYPGVTVPFGMIQLSPDNGISAWDWCSGYHYTDSIIVGFSHTHLSGTGIGDLTDILIMPTNRQLDLTVLPQGEKAQYPDNPEGLRDRLPYKSKFSHEKETALAGYYQVYLETPKVNVELTANKRTGMQRYTFEKGDKQSVVLDLGIAFNWDKAVATQIAMKDTQTIVGYRHSKGWAKNQKVFYVIKFSKPMQTWDFYKNGKKIVEPKGSPSIEAEKTAAQFFFDNANSRLTAKVAISSVSIENAIANLQSDGQDFDATRQTASSLWGDALGKIQVETPTDSLKTIFYTALYHTQVAPVTFSDSNGDCRLQNDSIIKDNDFTVYSTLSLWDTFRAEQPLLTLLAPEKVSDIIQSMLLYYDEHKRLPVWTLSGNETNCMTGYHSIPVIVEAYKKGIRNFDVAKAYEAMKATMLQNDRGLKLYKKYGYIPYEKLDESVTISLEYAYDDWCVAQMALALENEEDYVFFMKRSEAYKKLFDAKTGFMRGKSAKGKWNAPFDPKRSNHREHTDYTEGNAWQHSWFVLHDVPNFIKMHGGNKPFLKKLEQLFVESSEITGENVSVDISGLIGQYAHGNEPSHHIPYLFNFAGQPWRTQYWVREILKSQYNTTPEGLSGNEDCGQMSAWYVFGAIGLYPFNPASANYQIGSPIFEKTSLHLPLGKTFTILAENTSDTNRYIQSATLNGNEFNETEISHETILEGGVLKFIMGATPNKNWGVN